MPTAPVELELQQAHEYKKCSCLGKSPLRACLICAATGWLKPCPTCLGSGTLSKSARQSNSQGRTERCGFCMGAGWVPCPKVEVAQAEELSGEGPSIPAPSAPPPTATEKRLATRRANMEKARGAKAKKTRGAGDSVPISPAAERPQNPLEAMELELPGDVPSEAQAAADKFRSMTMEDRSAEVVGEMAGEMAQEVLPSSFRPEE